MKHNDVSKYYSQFIESFLIVENEKFDLETTEISSSIFKHIFKMKCVLWKQSVIFKRRIRISISELFQDIVALYLKLALKDEFEIILEEKVGKLRPDILIKYKGQNLFILEIKTTIGWDRKSINGSIQNRIKDLSENFNISKDNIVYIFMSPWNVNRQFAAKYWNSDYNKPMSLPEEFPYNKIRPLMTFEDAYYFKHEKGFDRQTNYIEYSEKQIDDLSINSTVIPLELTIKEIIKAADNINATSSENKKTTKTLLERIKNRLSKANKNKADIFKTEGFPDQLEEKESGSNGLSKGEQYHAFWSELKKDIESALNISLSEAPRHQAYQISSNKRAIHFEWYFQIRKNRFGVELHFESTNRQNNIDNLKLLKPYLSKFETKINKKAVIDEHWGGEKKGWTRFYFELDQSNIDDKLKDFAKSTMIEMYKYFNPILDKEK